MRKEKTAPGRRREKEVSPAGALFSPRIGVSPANIPGKGKRAAPSRGAGLEEVLSSLQPPLHLCHLYSSPGEARRVLVSFLKTGLEKNEKCLCIADASRVRQIRRALSRRGVDVSGAEKTGRLAFSPGPAPAGGKGSPAPGRMISFLAAQAKQSSGEGFPSLRTAMEMGRAGGNRSGLRRLLDYEDRLNRIFFKKFPSVGLCQYDRSALDPAGLKSVLLAHPVLLIGCRTVRNFHYRPGKKPGRLADPGAEIQAWLDGVVRGNALLEEAGKISRNGDQDLAAARSRLYREWELRKEMEEEREAALGLIRLLHSPGDEHELIRTITTYLKNWSGCDAVGVRLRQGPDFPYFETRGFPEEFVRAENSLCRDAGPEEPPRDGRGNPVLDCMCGNVLQGRFDPAQPFFTEHGSFWTNSTGELLASTTEEERLARTRNRCHGEGYESVALIPVRRGGETFGLLQFNDRRKGRFNREKIRLLERMGDSIAIALTQRRAEEALRESEERYFSIFENSMDAVLLASPDGGILAANPEACRIFGRTEEELIRAGMDGVVDSSDPRLSAALEARRKTGRFRGELVFYRRDGTRFPGEISSAVFKDRLGRERASMIIRDITERKAAEAALREGEKKYRGLIDSIADAFFALDEEMRVIHWNQAAEAFTGIPGPQAAGRSLFEVFPEIRGTRAEKHYREVMATRRPGALELEYRRGGTDRVFEFHVYPFEEGISVFIRDVTERRRAEERALGYQAELQSLASELSLAEERERRRLAAELHDRIGQSLALAKLQLEEMGNRLPPRGGAREDFDRIRETLDQTIRDTRSLTFEISPPILYEAGLGAALEWLAEDFQERYGIRILLEMDRDLPAPGPDLAALFFRAVRELLINAAKHSGAGRARVTLRWHEGRWEIGVEDDGAGFDPCPGLKGEFSRKSFGLFSLRERLKHLGGSLEIASRKGKGARVCLKVPPREPAVPPGGEQG